MVLCDVSAVGLDTAGSRRLRQQVWYDAGAVADVQQRNRQCAQAHKLPRQFKSNARPAAGDGDVRAVKRAPHLDVFFRGAKRPF